MTAPTDEELAAFRASRKAGMSLRLALETLFTPGRLERLGYLCIQGYPTRICGGCTSACCEPVYVEPKGAP